MGFRDEQAADCADILSDAGEPVTYQSQTFQALVALPTLALMAAPGGIDEGAAFVVKVMRSAVAFDPPAIGEDAENGQNRISFRGETYRIIRIGDHPGYPMLILSVTTPYE